MKGGKRGIQKTEPKVTFRGSVKGKVRDKGASLRIHVSSVMSTEFCTTFMQGRIVEA